MKCGSDGCDRLAVARWAIVSQPLTTLHGTALLCLGHDEWYQDMAEARDGTGPRGAFRIGLLADEICLHSPSQRESASPEVVCTCPPVKWTLGADFPTHMLRCPLFKRCTCYPSGRMNLSPADGHLSHCSWYRPGPS